MFAATMALVVATWPADLEPRLTRPNDQQTKIAPLTLAYGAQQAPVPSLALAELIPIVASWQQTWEAQRAPQSLAWLVPLSPYLAHTPPPSLIWTAWEPPPLPPPRPVAIAPLTLAYGQQPPPQPPLSVLELTHIVGMWAQTWAAQTAPEGAAWNVPPVVSAYVPPPRVRYDILASHQDPVTIALVQTFVVGQSATDDPPRQSPLSPANQAIAQQAWTPPFVAPPAPKPTAGWNVPPILISLPHVPPPSQIWTAWEPPWIAPPAPVDLAPLALVYGQQPVPQAPLSVSHLQRIAGSWAETWNAQSAPKSASWDVPPLITVLPHVPPPAAIWTAWEPPYIAPPRPVTIAPLTLVYGQAPAVQPPLGRTVAGIILPAWPADLEPRLGRPNAERTRIAPLTLVYGIPPAPHGPLSPVQLSVIRWAWEPPWHVLQFFEHGNYVPGSFVSLAPVRNTSATAINVVAYTVDLIGDTFTADLIGVTFTIERLPS